MTPPPLPGPAPITVGERTLDLREGTCFACPTRDHPRVWAPAPDDPRRKRTLVLCFDGTGESFDADNSNIPQFLAMLKKDDPSQQVVYYQAGIGTYTGNVLKTPIFEKMSKFLDLMFAYDIGDHIKEGYMFLMQNYRAEDNICILGFSRGAITARALAGMLQKIGLIPTCNLEQLPFAYAMYTREDYDGLMLSTQFKRTFSIDVKIAFLGVWDTVHSVGLIEKHLPFTGTNNAISYFRHALSLDERRVKFRPFFCTIGRTGDGRKDTDGSECSGDASMDSPRMIEDQRDSGWVQEYEGEVNVGPLTDIEEVFFAGAHCDVGGGSVKNGERHSLARIPLRWMIRECFATRSGIVFDAHMLKNEVGLDIDIHGMPMPIHRPALEPGVLRLRRPGDAELGKYTLRHIPVAIVSGLSSPFVWVRDQLSKLRIHDSKKFIRALRELERRKPVTEGEPHEELNDALSPIFDQIELHPWWNIIEWLPWLVKKQEVEQADSVWAYKFLWNRGKGREVYKEVMKRDVKIKVHRSVKTRMLALPMEGSRKQYVPNIRFPIDGILRPLRRDDEWLADKPEHFVWVD